MGCTTSNLRHEIGEPGVVKPLESNGRLETRSPHSGKAVQIADGLNSGSCYSSNDVNNIPTRELFPSTLLDVASAPNFDLSGFVLELNPRRFSTRDSTTVELLHCLNIVKSWIAIPGMLRVIADVVGCETEQEVVNALCEQPVVVNCMSTVIPFNGYGLIERSADSTKDIITLHYLLVNLLSVSVQDAYPSLIANHTFLNAKTLFHELIHIIYRRIHLYATPQPSELSTLNSDGLPGGRPGDSGSHFRSPRTKIGNQVLTDVGEIMEMLVFGGVVFNQADKIGTFYCDKLICVGIVESGVGYCVNNMDAAYLTAALNGTASLQDLTLTGTERGTVDYATWCCRHLEDCGFPASQPQNVSNMVAGPRFRRPTEGCTSYRRKY